MKTGPRTRVGIAVGVLGVIGVVAWLHSSEVPTDRQRAARARAGTAEGEARRGVVAAMAGPVRVTAAAASAERHGSPIAPGKYTGPLPALNQPLKEVFALLEARARGGDAYAACRLASDLSRCGQRRIDALKIEGIEHLLKNWKEATPAKRASLQRELEELRGFVEPIAELCEGIPEAQLARAWEYALAAANAGHLPSMMRYAMFKTGITEVGPAAEADAWIAWRENAGRMVEQAVASGDVRGYDAASRFHFRRDSGVWILPEDPVRALAYRIALRGHPIIPVSNNESFLNTIASELTPAQVAQGELMAVDLRKNLNMSVPDGDPPPRKYVDLIAHRDSAYCNP